MCLANVAMASNNSRSGGFGNQRFFNGSSNGFGGSGSGSSGYSLGSGGSHGSHHAKGKSHFLGGQFGLNPFGKKPFLSNLFQAWSCYFTVLL